jgi:hypothetical protein
MAPLTSKWQVNYGPEPWHIGGDACASVVGNLSSAFAAVYMNLIVINQQMHFTLPPSHPHPLHPLLIHMLTWVKLETTEQWGGVV